MKKINRKKKLNGFKMDRGNCYIKLFESLWKYASIIQLYQHPIKEQGEGRTERYNFGHKNILGREWQSAYIFPFDGETLFLLEGKFSFKYKQIGKYKSEHSIMQSRTQ